MLLLLLLAKVMKKREKEMKPRRNNKQWIKFGDQIIIHGVDPLLL